MTSVPAFSLSGLQQAHRADEIRLLLDGEPGGGAALIQRVARGDERHHAARTQPVDVLLIIEVADTFLAYDRDAKLPLYARHGIPEVWIVISKTDACTGLPEPPKPVINKIRRSPNRPYAR